MTLKDISKQLTTAVQTVPNLVQILRDGLQQVETGGEVTYSTTEKKIGKWIDNSDLYEKTVYIEHLPNGALLDDWVYYNTGIEGNISVIDMTGIVIFANGNRSPIPYVLANSVQGAILNQIGLFFKAETMQIGIMCGADRSTASGYVTLRYTKVTT